MCSSLHFSGSLPHLNVFTSVDGLIPALSYLHYFHSRHIYSHWHLAISLSKWTLWPDLALKFSWILRSCIFWVPVRRPFYTNVLWFQRIFKRFTFMWLSECQIKHWPFKSYSNKTIIAWIMLLSIIRTSTKTFSAARAQSTYLLSLSLLHMFPVSVI